MNQDHLRTFLAVVAEGSFSAAARGVHVSQSTVSSHIRSLEDYLQTRLLHREPRVAPTAAGEVLVTYATRILHLQREAVREVQGGDAGSSGPVVVAAEPPAIEAALPRALAALCLPCPHLQVTVRAMSAGRAVAAVRAGDVHVALVLVAVAPGDLIRCELGHLEARVYGAPDRVSDRFVSCPPPLGLPLPAGATCAVEVPSSWAARRAVVEGAGIGLLSTGTVADDVAEGRLEEISWPGTPVVRHLGALHAEAPSSAGGVEAFLGALRSTRPPATTRVRGGESVEG